jgi:hypothetical protein
VSSKLGGDIWTDKPLSYLTDHYEARDPSLAAKHDQLIADFGEGTIDRTTLTWMNYDIELEVAPFPTVSNKGKTP